MDCCEWSECGKYNFDTSWVGWVAYKYDEPKHYYSSRSAICIVYIVFIRSILEYMNLPSAFLKVLSKYAPLIGGKGMDDATIAQR